MTINEINKNAVLSEVLGVLVSQTEKGLKKYGNSVNPNEYSTIEWIQHAIEEHADAIVYLTVLKNKLVEGTS